MVREPQRATQNRQNPQKRSMWFSTAVPLLILLAGSVGAQLRGDSARLREDTLLNDTVVVWSDQGANMQHLEIEHRLDVGVDSTRRLAGSLRMFEPLFCNRVRCSAGSTTWKLANFNLNGKVTIPCGMCVVMDYTASGVLELPYGLNIEGSLRFPNGYSITIKTPFVHVQGVLEMYALRNVTDKPDIKILLTGTNELLASFIPADNNKFKCSADGASIPSPCFVGRKPFVIAGGMVTIRGVPNGCATWTNLQDFVSADLPSPTEFTQLPMPNPNHPNPVCRSVGPYMQDDFETSVNPHGWTGGYGALFTISGGSFRVWDRKDANEHAPTLDMRKIRDCLIPEQDYLFRARIKLTKPGIATGTPTTCAKLNNSCLALQSTVRSPIGSIGRRKGVELPNHAFRYGVWQDFYATVTFAEDELNLNNIFQILQLRGPEPQVEIEMDDVLFSLPPPAAVPDPTSVCGGNIILNGNAELDSIHPYPIKNNGGALTVEESGGNKYFHHYARTSDNDSIYYVMDAIGCLVPGGKYMVSARIRIDSSSPVPTRIDLRSTFVNGSVVQRAIAECSTNSSWTVCETTFTLLRELTGDGLREMRLQFGTVAVPNRDMDIDDIELILMDGSVRTIIVPDNGISNCWNTGAEILITSHTLNYDDGQVRRIVSTPTRYGVGFVKLELDSAIVPPTTLKQSEDFAVEVALLNRNILFEGDTDDPDSLLGAHFIVLHTPTSTAKQYIEGIEFRNFGQQGVLGKYPIHFHLCDDAKGSVVTKNMIRESNQRCIVAHGTHNLTITENVAYDTRGHCFITEDGGEIDNVFRRNLGALTQPSTRLTRPVESDDFPSTFWCSNPQNTWVGNVAAGSRNNGFWFELQTEVRAPTAYMPLSQGMIPRLLNLKLFRDNVAHSNSMHGLRTYPFGMMPSEEAVFYNTRSYRNNLVGVFFHNSRNLAVSGGVLADNMIQFDFDRGAENIRLEGTSVIGVTDLYKEVVRTQPGAPAHSDVVVGLELHGFTLDMTRNGATIRNITFSGFADTLASHSALIDIDDAVSGGNFDFWTTFQGVTIADDVTPAQFDFTRALAKGIDNIYLTDLDSGMRPRGSSANGVSTIISNTPAMTRFIDLSKCMEFAERGYMYCQDICLRGFVLAVPPSVSEDFVLRINEESNPADFLDVNGKFDYKTLNADGTGGPDVIANTSIRRRRYFAVALPPARYVFSFIRQGSQAWATSVEFTMEEAQCATPMEKNWTILGRPPSSESECRELIRNGNLEGLGSDWLHDESGLQIASGQGISGSKALSDINLSAPANGLIGQYLDTRCLLRGQQYEVRAWVKLTLSNGSTFACDSVSGCPKARLKIRTPKDEDGLEFSEFTMDLVSFFDRPYSDTGWNLLRGVFTVDARIEGGASVLFFIERGKTGIKMLLDNISVSLIPKQCNQLVFNGNFSDSTSSFWSTNLASVRMVMKGTALEMTNRSSFSHSPEQNIRTGCMKASERYIASARMLLENADGTLYACDPTRTTGDLVCPKMRLRSFVDIGLPTYDNSVHDGGSIAITDHGTSNGWYIMSGVFSGNNYDAVADKITLTFDQVSSKKDFVIDDVSITPLAKNCNQLFLNGDAEYGETPSFWTHWQANGGEKIALVSVGADNHAFMVHQRAQAGDGIHQFIDSRCLIAASSWKLVASMKLVSRTTGQGVTCNPSEQRLSFACPPVRIAGWSSSGAKEVEQPFFMTNRPNWSANTFNTYEVVFTVDNALANVDRISIGVRGYNLDWDLIVDDISLRPL